jgi:uncharacterized protein
LFLENKTTTNGEKMSTRTFPMSNKPDRQITDTEVIEEIINRNQVMNLAMCYADEPYILTVNFYYDHDDKCFYFHGRKQGKKIAILDRNPVVWGNIVEDLGYVTNKLTHRYRSVQFLGRVTFVTDEDQKTAILKRMIGNFEPTDSIEHHWKKVTPEVMELIFVAKIEVQHLTGKQNT